MNAIELSSSISRFVKQIKPTNDPSDDVVIKGLPEWLIEDLEKSANMLQDQAKEISSLKKQINLLVVSREPIAYCEDLDSFGMNVASQLLGLDSTDKEFLETPLYAHPMRELTDEEIMNEWYSECCPNGDLIIFARAIIKASRGEK